MQTILRLRSTAVRTVAPSLLAIVLACIAVADPVPGDIAFNGAVFDHKVSLYILSRAENGVEVRRQWMRRGQVFDGYKLIHYDRDQNAVIVVKDDVPHLLRISHGAIFHPDPTKPLSREHAVIAVNDYLDEMEQKIKASLPTYKSLAENHTSELAGKENTGERIYFEGIANGKRFGYSVVPLSRSNLPEFYTENLTSEDWNLLNRRFALISAGKFFADKGAVLATSHQRHEDGTSKH